MTIEQVKFKGIKPIGYSDQGGRPDAVQVMINKKHAFVGHIFNEGVSVIDVNDPRNPKAVNFLPVHGNSWSIHMQTHEDIMLVAEEFNFFSVRNADNKMAHLWQQDQYYSKAQGLNSKDIGIRGEDFSAGMRVYDISNPAEPKPISFMPVEGLGLHRLWWMGGRYAYASALLDGFLDHILIVIDLADITKPVEVGRFWIPGMWVAGGEEAHWNGRYACHHAIVKEDLAFGSWRDGGVTIVDMKNKSDPKLLAHENFCPPFGGATHNALPLLDRGLMVVCEEAVHDYGQERDKHTWIFDIRELTNPVSIATCPHPSDQDYTKKVGHFGPHNLWENRTDGFISDNLVFVAWQNAGLRVFDISNPFRPEEVGYFVPPTPEKIVDPRSTRTELHTCDVNVQADGLIYMTDYNAGLYIGEQDL